MLRFSIITLFPEMFSGIFSYSIIDRAREKKKVEIQFINLRNFGIGSHKSVDDRPYGGGAGMILRVDVVDKAIQFARKGIKNEKVVLLDPKGKTYNQNIASQMTKLSHIILICGHYEGYDERIRSLVDSQISIGDYIVSGGEIPAMVIVESITRLLPGVLKKEEASKIESYSKSLGKKQLEFPQYTRPETYRDKSVPKILLSGNHKEIKKYRNQEAFLLTKKLRPDLIK